MTKRGLMFSEWMMGGTILFLTGISGTAFGVPVSATAHHATTVQTTSVTSPGIVSLTDLFGPGATSSAADREGTADFSANNLPQMHHLSQPPKTSSGGGVDASPSVAGVPDG